MKKFKPILVAVVTSLFLVAGCTKEDPDDQPIDGEVLQLQGISDETRDAIPLDGGEIGIEIDTRTLAVLGYTPTTADVTIEGSLSAYSKKEIEVDEHTNIATFKISVEDLEEEVVNTFAEGVPIQVTVYDNLGNELESESVTRFIFNTSNKTLNIETEKARLLRPLAMNPNVAYYLATVSETDTRVLGEDLDQTNGSRAEYNESGIVQPNGFDLSEEPAAQLQKMTFVPQGNNTFAIRTALLDSYLEVDMEFGQLRWNKANAEEGIEWLGIEDKHLFYIDQTTEGWIKLKPVSTGEYLKLNPFNQVISSYYDGENGTDPEAYDLKLRPLATDIEWEFENLGTKYSAPIIPPSQMDFAFDQTIINCSSSTGTYEVGTDSEETKTISISLDESMNLLSSRTSSKSATVEAEASGKVFGIGVSVKASGTISTSATTAFGASRSEQQGYEETVTQSVSTKRSIEVAPYTAIEVFDVIQRIENVRIPFVQRFLLRGDGGNGSIALTGAEIATQMGASRFGGVITQVESDYVIFSIRGSVNVDNYFEFNNTLNDIAGACD